MKNISLILTIFLISFVDSFGQINPVQNLTWDHYYVSPNNYFILEWDEPASPHDELIGYNIYREDELYRFQTENSLYNLESGANCGEDFLFFENGMPFFAHVVAVYNPGPVESTFTETVFVKGLALNINDFENYKAILYPNPTNGILNVGNDNLNKILIFDISGKQIKVFEPKNQIDLSDMSKGIYLIKLISDEGILTDKIIIK
jgi:hypothetical protein